MNIKTDKTLLSRAAQDLIVDHRKGYGTPPTYGEWLPLLDARADRIEINHGSDSSVATITFPEGRWNSDAGVSRGDMIRIRTDQVDADQQTVVFQGFIVKKIPEFFGGSDKTPAFERYAVVCMDYRWLLAISSPIYGQAARGPDDYTNYGTDSASPIADSFTFLSGRRTIFNENGKPNMDSVDLVYSNVNIPIFATPDAEPWTALDMIRYILSPAINRAYEYLPIDDPTELTGLDHDDFNKVLNHVVIDGLNIIEALDHICSQLGFSFREDYTIDGISLVFYKIGSATVYARDDDNAVILHNLHAPAVGENIATAVSQGKKMLWQARFVEDIAAVVNNPWGLGAIDRFEFTAELVPAWLDDDLVIDDSDSYANLFVTESDLADVENKNVHDYYKYHHSSGQVFTRDVGRKWSLNESGKYSSSSTYNRGMPFDFATVIEPAYILDSTGKRLFAPFNRQLLSCLTIDKDSLNSVGIKVEFSFDSGTTWQVIPCVIKPLPGECGIYIEEPNLAEISDQELGTISGGDLDGFDVNLFSSIADDVLNERVFKNDEWHTRIRVTASVQMDQRLARQSAPSAAGGSPFLHSTIYDFSEKYGLTRRTNSSVYDGSDLSAFEVDHTDWFDDHLKSIRKANEDPSISGDFTLERLWLGDGSGFIDFCVGDQIERISGREYSLAAPMGDRTVYPEIIKIVILPDRQKMKLITRDLRFAEVTL